MKLFPIAAMLVVLALPFSAAVAQDTIRGSFPVVKLKTFDGEKFVFPSGMQGSVLNIVFLGMGNDRESGEQQQGQLLDWQAALEAAGVFSDSVMPYHFSAMSSPPFFVKGMISGAMSKSYEGRFPMSQAGILYLKDLEDFAAEVELPIDGQPTIVIADASGQPLLLYKGLLSDAGLVSLVEAIRIASGEVAGINDDAAEESVAR
ncbi:MAG: hypothetical protein P8M26_10645 [Gammaproteobacteria bacterium]|jgi:hypothetical protein|nr:hypothetical protein [Gammaproteobacteria bacterium]